MNNGRIYMFRGSEADNDVSPVPEFTEPQEREAIAAPITPLQQYDVERGWGFLWPLACVGAALIGAYFQPFLDWIKS